jgi:dTDP-glucose 4,6-dehydratase
VGDIIEGFIKTAETPEAVGQVINLGSGRSVSIKELARIIVSLVGSEREIVTDPERLRPEAGEVWRLECDNRRAREVLDWQPAVSLKEGLQRTVEYIAAHLERYKSGLYNL